MAGDNKQEPLLGPREETAADSSFFRNVFMQDKLAKTRTFFMVSAIGAMATLYAAKFSTNVVLQAGFSAGGVLLAFFLLEVWRIYSASKKQIPGSLCELWIKFKDSRRPNELGFNQSGEMCYPDCCGLEIRDPELVIEENQWIEYLLKHGPQCKDLTGMDFLQAYQRYKVFFDQEAAGTALSSDESRQYQRLSQQKQACLKNMAKILSKQHAPDVDPAVDGPQPLLVLWQRFCHAQKHTLLYSNKFRVAEQWIRYVADNKALCEDFDRIAQIFENHLKTQPCVDKFVKFGGEGQNPWNWAGRAVSQLRESGSPFIPYRAEDEYASIIYRWFRQSPNEHVIRFHAMLDEEWLDVLGSVIEQQKAEELSEAAVSPEDQPAFAASPAVGSVDGEEDSMRNEKKHAPGLALTGTATPSSWFFANRPLTFFDKNSQTALAVVGSASLIAAIGLGICEAKNLPSLAARWTMGVGVAGCLFLLLAAATFSAKQRESAQLRI